MRFLQIILVLFAFGFAAGPVAGQPAPGAASGPLPDLAIVDVRFLTGGRIGIALRNNGDGASGPTTVAIYVGGAVKVEAPLAAIQPGMMTIMALESPGPKVRIEVMVDPENRVAETDEDNNRSLPQTTPRQ